MTVTVSQKSALDVRPLSDAVGAEVRGLDLLHPLDPGTVEALKAAFLEHHLLCVRGDPLPAAAFARFAKHFGEPQFQLLRDKRSGDVPEVSVFDTTYQSPEDKPEDFSKVRLSGWHTDDSYFETPSKITLLQSIEIPTSGGQTRFCNTRRAYDELSDESKAEIDGLKAVHSYDTMRAPARALERTEEEKAETPDVVHPLVRTHEDTGQKAIYFNSNRTDHVVGMDRAASDNLLDRLHAHMTQPRYRYDHNWAVGDILIWDNRSVIHSVNVDYPVGQTRQHQRILLKGPRPV